VTLIIEMSVKIYESGYFFIIWI